jgi:large subunit ribosomal protein L14
MINVGSYIKVVDNSGVREVQCLRVLKKPSKVPARVGDMITVSVKKVIPKARSKLTKGKVARAIVVRTSQPTSRIHGATMKFDEAAVVLIGSKNQVLGSRLTGWLTHELRGFSQTKILALTSKVL